MFIDMFFSEMLYFAFYKAMQVILQQTPSSVRGLRKSSLGNSLMFKNGKIQSLMKEAL